MGFADETRRPHFAAEDFKKATFGALRGDDAHFQPKSVVLPSVLAHKVGEELALVAQKMLVEKAEHLFDGLGVRGDDHETKAASAGEV